MASTGIGLGLSLLPPDASWWDTTNATSKGRSFAFAKRSGEGEHPQWSRFLYEASISLDLPFVATRAFIIEAAAKEAAEVFSLDHLNNGMTLLLSKTEPKKKPKSEEELNELVSQATEVCGALPRALVLRMLVNEDFDLQRAVMRLLEVDEKEIQKEREAEEKVKRETMEEERRRRKEREEEEKRNEDLSRKKSSGGDVPVVIGNVVADGGKGKEAAGEERKEKKEKGKEKDNGKGKGKGKKKKKTKKNKGKERAPEEGSANAKTASGSSSSAVGKNGKLKSLQELCLQAASTDWYRISAGFLKLPPPLQDRVINFLCSVGVFGEDDSGNDSFGAEDYVESLEQQEHAMQELNDMFSDILGGDGLGDAIDFMPVKGQNGRINLRASGGGIGGSGSGSEGGGDGMKLFGAGGMIDVELARTLQEMEREAERTMLRMIQEDERLARELASQFSREGSTSTPSQPQQLQPSQQLQPKEKPEQGAVVDQKLINPDLALAKALIEEEKRAIEERKKREEEDERIARMLLKEEAGGAGGSTGSGSKGLASSKETLTDEELVKRMMEQEMREEQERRKRDEEEGLQFAKLLELEQGGGGTGIMGLDGSGRRRRVEEDERMARMLADEEQARQLHNETVGAATSEELARRLQREEEERVRKEQDERTRKLVADLEEENRREEERRKQMYTPPVYTPPVYAPPVYTPPVYDGPEDWNEEDWKDSRFFTGTQSLAAFLQARRGQRVVVRKVVKPELAERYEKKWTELIMKHGQDNEEGKPRIAFHGTRSNLVSKIADQGLLVPGSAGVKHVTDSGWYGRGIYLSPNPDLSLGYTQGGKMFVCSVLMGKVYKCPGRMDGQPCKRGYDSHMSPCGQEYIIFNAAQVLPCYVIEFTQQIVNTPTYTPAYTAPYGGAKKDCVLQ